MRHLLLSVACICGLAAAEPKIEVFPKTITFTNKAQFDAQGRYRKSSSELQFTLQIKPPAGTQLVASRGVQVSTVLSDAGESLVPKERMGNTGEEKFHEYERELNQYDVNFDLANPTKPLGEITSLSGVLTLAVAAGAPKQAKLAPVKDWLGKAVEIEAIHEEITVENTSSLTITGSKSLFERIQQVKFFAANGVEIKCSGWGQSQGNNSAEVRSTYHVTVPDDGAITIVFLPEVSEVAIPFTFAKLPVNSRTPDKKPGAAKVQVTEVDGSKPEDQKVKTPKQKSEGVKDTGAQAGGF